jgi:hypothetical protein
MGFSLPITGSPQTEPEEAPSPPVSGASSLGNPAPSSLRGVKVSAELAYPLSLSPSARRTENLDTRDQYGPWHKVPKPPSFQRNVIICDARWPN